MKYQDPGCAYCPPNVRACKDDEGEERRPDYCPIHVDGEALEAAWAGYDDPFVHRVARESAIVEADTYFDRVWGPELNIPCFEQLREERHR